MEGAYPSQLLEKAVCEFSKLPGIGRKTALRLVLDLLRRTEEEVDGFATAVTRLRKEVKHCKVCHNISDTDVCPICSDRHRDSTSICVVENIRDVMAVENTQQYNGLYHVLGGIISPMDGVGPSDIEIDSLVERVAAGVLSTIGTQSISRRSVPQLSRASADTRRRAMLPKRNRRSATGMTQMVSSSITVAHTNSAAPVAV